MSELTIHISILERKRDKERFIFSIDFCKKTRENYYGEAMERERGGELERRRFGAADGGSGERCADNSGAVLVRRRSVER